jgi:hypothetical protein
MIILRFGMQGEGFLSVLMASVMCLHSSMKEEDILSILMASVICVHFSQHAPHNTIKQQNT